MATDEVVAGLIEADISVISGMEDDPTELRELAVLARRLADESTDDAARKRLLAIAAEYEERAADADIDDATGRSER